MLGWSEKVYNKRSEADVLRDVALSYHITTAYKLKSYFKQKPASFL